MALSKVTTFFEPSSAITSRLLGEAKAPLPVTTVTLRCFAMPPRPPVRRLTTLSFQPRSLSRSICGAAKLMPLSPMSWASSITLAACSKRLGRDAADIEADAAEHRPAFDQHDLGAEIGGAEGGAVAAGSGAEHQHFGVQIARDGRGRRGGRGGRSRRARPRPPAPSSSRMTAPSPTLSPTLTFSSLTTPPTGAGTSIVALSDSSTISGSSALITSPALTSTSMIGTSLKSPISGTLIASVMFAPDLTAPAGGRLRAARRARARNARRPRRR